MKITPKPARKAELAELFGPKAEKLINRRACKDYALKISKQNRASKFTRVSKSALDMWEELLRQIIYKNVLVIPSKGKTITYER